ncbi:MAG TPA: DUF6048 family protein [Bacteroidales bacterium]|nr:DUF6048 family protein [Bacteroidales bacterium]
MRRTYAYIISIIFMISCFPQLSSGQDTIDFPLKIRLGIEAVGPVSYYTDRNILNTEVYLSADLNEKRSVILSGGYLDYKYSQYNYEYSNKGFFVKAGMDFNLIKPLKSQGKYWAGIGFRYGISHFTSQVPGFSVDNYWGSISGSIPAQTSWGHYLEASPGIRTEIFRSLSLGCSVNIRMLIHTGLGKDLRPIYFPGYGPGANKTSTSFSYFLIWNIPFKKIRVIQQKAPPEESDDTEDNTTNR